MIKQYFDINGNSVEIAASLGSNHICLMVRDRGTKPLVFPFELKEAEQIMMSLQIEIDKIKSRLKNLDLESRVESIEKFIAGIKIRIC